MEVSCNIDTISGSMMIIILEIKWNIIEILIQGTVVISFVFYINNSVIREVSWRSFRRNI